MNDGISQGIKTFEASETYKHAEGPGSGVCDAPSTDIQNLSIPACPLNRQDPKEAASTSMNLNELHRDRSGTESSETSPRTCQEATVPGAQNIDHSQVRESTQDAYRPSKNHDWSSPYLLSQPIGSITLSSIMGGRTTNHHANAIPFHACPDRDPLPKLPSRSPSPPGRSLVFPITRYFPHESVPGRQRIIRIVPFADTSQVLAPATSASMAPNVPPFLSLDTGVEPSVDTDIDNSMGTFVAAVEARISTALSTPRPSVEETFNGLDEITSDGSDGQDSVCGGVTISLEQGFCGPRRAYSPVFLDPVANNREEVSDSRGGAITACNQRNSCDGGVPLCEEEGELLEAPNVVFPTRKRRRRTSCSGDVSLSSDGRSV